MNENIQILDAGMGKTLKMLGVDIPDTIWSANALLVAPNTVARVHRDNIDSGADIITTNSYGVIKADLAKEGLQHKFGELNHLAGVLARQAVRESGKDIKIAGSLPPLNGSYRADRVLAREIIEPLYAEQARYLAPHVDMFLCETMSSIVEATAAISGASGCGKPVLVSFTLDDESSGKLRSGETLEAAIDAIMPFDPSGILVNCCPPERITEAMPILVNAQVDICGGYGNSFTRVPMEWLLDGDKEQDGTIVLRDDLPPDRYSLFVQSWVDAGANLVGGCCGTTARHTRAISDLLA